MTLFEIERALLECYTESVDPETGEFIGDIFDIEKLENLRMEKEKKIESIALWVKNLSADVEAYKKQEYIFVQRRERAQKKVDFLKSLLQQYLDNKKFSTEQVEISFRKSQKTIVDNPELLDEKYLTIPKPEPKKAVIKKALLSGEVIKGARLEDRYNITIR